MSSSLSDIVTVTASFPPQTPQVYTLGNLVRAGYGATEDGVFPYSYNSCDVGIFPNQTNIDGTTPAAALTNGDPNADGALSYLRGQKLSTCPCRGEDHPNPTSSMRGRGAPQIDVLNVQTTAKTEGEISQTLRFAPMNAAYTFAANGTQVVNTTVAKENDYLGRATCVFFPFSLCSPPPLSCFPRERETRLIIKLENVGKKRSRPLYRCLLGRTQATGATMRRLDTNISRILAPPVTGLSLGVWEDPRCSK